MSYTSGYGTKTFQFLIQQDPCKCAKTLKLCKAWCLEMKIVISCFLRYESCELNCVKRITKIVF